jgi:hypothetical protein
MGLRDSQVEPAIAVSDLDRARRFYEDQLLDAGHFRAAWVKDPDGNTLAISEVSG